MTRDEAQRRADRLRIFREEAEVLLDGAAEDRARIFGKVDSELADLRKRFDVDTSAGGRRLSWGMRLAATAGAIALSAAVVLMFYQFWDTLWTWQQVCFLMAAPLLLTGLAEWAHRKEASPYFTSLLAATAVAAFVMNISALGEIFSLPESQHAFLMWAVFALALALRFDLLLPLAAAVAMGWFWLSATMHVLLTGGRFDSFLDRIETGILVSGALFAMSLIPPLRTFDRRRGVVECVPAVIMALLFTVGGLHRGASYFGDAREVYPVAGLILSGAACILAVRSGRPALGYTTFVTFVGFLFWRLFDWGWNAMPHWLFSLLIAAVSAGLIFLMRSLRGREAEA